MLEARRYPVAIAFAGLFLAIFASLAHASSIRLDVRTIVSGLEHPWSVAHLPDGSILVTERAGRLQRVDQKGRLKEIAGVPEVAAVGQGGLLDVAIAPDFERSRHLFLSYAEPREGGNGTSVVRARLQDDRLVDLEVIFRQLPTVESTGHFGSRLVFAPDGSLFVTLGERQLRHFTIRAQDLESHFGKIVRIRTDGSVPADNPFLLVPGAKPEIYSYGHRNVQGAAVHPETGELWAVEHGPRGGDELNIVRPGANYGWPLVTYGITYQNTVMGVGTSRAGIEEPIKYWVPSIGTSGMAFYTSDRIPQWKGSLFIGGLTSGELVRLELKGNVVVNEERLLRDLRERVRDVRQGPDGCLYILTDSPQGKLIRLDASK